MIRTCRKLLHLWPFRKGKQRVAHGLYSRFLRQLPEAEHFVHNGVQFELDLRDRMQAIFFLTGLYEPRTIATCLEHLPADRKSVYVDIGANVGLLSGQIKAGRPHSECHLFEADRKIFSRLKRNFELNRPDSVTLNHAAVSDKSGQRVVFHSSFESTESGWGRLANAMSDQPGEKQEVISIAIDDYLSQNQISGVDLMKIDVEGAEEKVILGAQRSMREKRIRAIVCEMNEEALVAFGTTTNGLKRLIESFGYREVKRVELNSLFLAV